VHFASTVGFWNQGPGVSMKDRVPQRTLGIRTGSHGVRGLASTTAHSCRILAFFSNSVSTMARIPTPEHIFLEVHQSLGLERPPSKHINQFTQLGFPLPRHKKFMEDLLNEIFSALEMDDQAKADALLNIDEWFAFDTAVAAHTWTHAATQQQVLWHLLAYSWVPGLARRLAFWSLAGSERGIPFDAGMPGGAFWFLPTWDQATRIVRLPVKGVLEWLLDLLGDQSLERTANALQHEQAQRKNMNALRTLQGWRLEGRLPKSARMIDELFHDGAELDFQGAFHLPAGLPEDEQFAGAIWFLRHRELTPEALAHEIPLQAILLHSIIDGKGSAEDNHAFVQALAIRYAAPSMQTVRQRLRVARMVQDAYQRLVTALCAPGVTYRCADPSQNPLLPLLALFHTVYNLTIQSFGQGTTNAEQDSWFESKFAPWDRCDLLLSIMPSARGVSHRLLGERLTRRFMVLSPDAPLPDLIPFAELDQAPSAVLERIGMLGSEADEDARIDALRKMAVTLPRTEVLQVLSAENSYLVVSQLAVTHDLPEEIRATAADRMHALAGTPVQAAGALVAKLALLFDRSTQARTKDAQSRTAALLQELESVDKDGTWKAPFLRFRARHRLMLNDFEGAAKDYRSALNACFDRNYGMLQANIAEEGLATEVAMRGMDRKTQDYWHRHIVNLGQGTPLFEDTAVRCDDFFWTGLYQPYVGIEVRTSQVTEELQDLIIRTFKLILDADLTRLKSWLLKYEGRLRSLKLKDVRGDSLLLLWMKQLTHLEQMTQKPVLLGALRPGRERPGAVMRKAIRVLVELWPEQARTCDFKRQTPLMIAADDGDAELTEALARLSDIDAQDYLGRTALHAAVTGGSSKCIELILDMNPDVEKVTVDEEQTALHTAVRFGNLKAVSLIAEEFPCRVDKVNAAGLTPLDLARDLLKNYKEWQHIMRAKKRRVGSPEDFQSIVVHLENFQV